MPPILSGGGVCRGQRLEDVLRDVNKKFKADVCKQGMSFDAVRRIPFSSPRMNYMTYGGMPVGRIIEFAGEEGGGKTTTALDLVAGAQKMFPDKQVLYVDIERTLDAEWAQKLGVDIDSLILFSPDEQTAEEVFEAVKFHCRNGRYQPVCAGLSCGNGKRPSIRQNH